MANRPLEPEAPFNSAPASEPTIKLELDPRAADLKKLLMLRRQAHLHEKQEAPLPNPSLSTDGASGSYNKTMPARSDGLKSFIPPAMAGECPPAGRGFSDGDINDLIAGMRPPMDGTPSVNKIVPLASAPTVDQTQEAIPVFSRVAGSSEQPKYGHVPAAAAAPEHDRQSAPIAGAQNTQSAAEKTASPLTNFQVPASTALVQRGENAAPSTPGPPTAQSYSASSAVNKTKDGPHKLQKAAKKKGKASISAVGKPLPNARVPHDVSHNPNAAAPVAGNSDSLAAPSDAQELRDLQDWLRFTNYYDEQHRTQFLSRRRRLDALDAERQKLLEEEREEVSAAIQRQGTPATAEAAGPPPSFSSILQAVQSSTANKQPALLSARPHPGVLQPSAVAARGPDASSSPAKKAAATVPQGKAKLPEKPKEQPFTPQNKRAAENAPPQGNPARHNPSAKRGRETVGEEGSLQGRPDKVARAADAAGFSIKGTAVRTNSWETPAKSYGKAEWSRDGTSQDDPKLPQRREPLPAQQYPPPPEYHSSPKYRLGPNNRADAPASSPRQPPEHFGREGWEWNKAWSPVRDADGREYDSRPRPFDGGAQGPRQISLGRGGESRFFILKSFNEENVLRSMEDGKWTTQLKNREPFENAFRTCRNVIFFFSVNKSHAFQGYARMLSPPSSFNSRSAWMDNIHWATTEPFLVDWHNTSTTDYRHCAKLTNDLTDGQPVFVAKDGQEVEEDCARRLMDVLDSSAKRQGKPPFGPPDRPSSAHGSSLASRVTRGRP